MTVSCLLNGEPNCKSSAWHFWKCLRLCTMSVPAAHQNVTMHLVEPKNLQFTPVLNHNLRMRHDDDDDDDDDDHDHDHDHDRAPLGGGNDHGDGW